MKMNIIKRLLLRQKPFFCGFWRGKIKCSEIYECKKYIFILCITVIEMWVYPMLEYVLKRRDTNFAASSST